MTNESADFDFLEAETILNLGHQVKIGLRPASAFDEKEQALVQVSGSFDEISETLKQLAWLAATLRLHRSGQFTVSDIDFRIQQALVRDSFETIFQVSLFSPAEAPQPDYNEPGQCWTSLFTESVLVYGFPVHGGNRPDGILGLEVPFEIMVAFAGVKFPVVLGERIKPVKSAHT